MNKEINFETFLFVGFNKFIISVNKKETFKSKNLGQIRLVQTI